jgi:uncharacterized membrane protein YhaH (DUF805 family)
MSWFVKCVKHYADFSGRARRKEYWMFVLFYLIFAIPVYVVAYMITTSIPLMILFYAYLLSLAVPLLAVQTRRLHDVGKSGKLLLLVYLAPAAVALIALVSGWVGGLFVGAAVYAIAGLLSSVMSLYLFALLVSNSKPGSNQYGPNPKETV